MSRTRHLTVALVLVLFTVVGAVQHWRVNGDDLTSTYIACQLLATGQQSHLYSHDPVDFSLVGDPLWTALAKSGGIARLQDVHPYVQTPLWAALLRPACMHSDFATFYHGFIVVLMLSTSGMLWLVVRLWAKTMYHPGWLTCICVGLYVSEPFKYAIFLAQTQIFFLFLTILATVMADRKREVLAGILLAAAGAVKITPLILLLYWIARGRWRAAATCMLALFCVAAVSIGFAGLPVFRESIATYRQLSNVLLLAMNNESFAAWAMAYRYPAATLLDWSRFPLPPIFNLIGVLGSYAAALVGARADEAADSEAKPPYGAVFSLIAVTLLNPIAWSHYFVILVIPAALFLDRRRNGGSAGWVLLTILLLCLSIYPTSHGAVVNLLHRYPDNRMIPYAARGEFTSAVLCLVALWSLWRARPSLPAADRDDSQVLCDSARI